MRSFPSTVKAVLIASLAIGLGIFSARSLAHDQHSADCSRSHHTQLARHSAHGAAGRGRRFRSLGCAGHGSSDRAGILQLQKPLPNTPLGITAALLAAATPPPAPEANVQPLSKSPVLALGSAARAPGSPRGPPLA